MGYALADTWSDVGTPRRVVAGADGFVYVLGDQEIRRLGLDGAPSGQVLPAAPRLWEIAVDASGTLYGASGSDVRRLGADGRTTWSTPVRSDKPSILVPYEVQPYLAALAWDGGSRVTLLYDSYRGDTNNAWLRFHQTGNGLDVEGPGFLFPTHAYWDLDYHNGLAYVLNRTTSEFRPQPQVEIYDSNGHASSVAPVPLAAPAERIAVAADGSVFTVSESRWIYHTAPDGRILDSWDAAGSRPDVRSRVTDLAVDGDGRVYVADPEQRQVRVYSRQEGIVNPPPRPGGSGLACQMVPNKWAEPTYLRLGEVTQVTLTLGGDCPVQAERADIVLVVDRSNSMSYEGGIKMAGAKAGVHTFVDLVDASKHQLALVAFGSYANLLVPLTQDKAAILRVVDGLEPLGGSEGGTDIAGGLNKATDELLGPRARKDDRTKPIIVLLTDGVAFNTTRLSTVAAADRARYEGMTVFSIGYGADVEPDLLRLVARTPDLYEFAADAAFLRSVYEKLGRYISALFLLKDVTIVDEIPGNMKYRPDLPADPPPAYDARGPDPHLALQPGGLRAAAQDELLARAAGRGHVAHQRPGHLRRPGRFRSAAARAVPHPAGHRMGAHRDAAADPDGHVHRLAAAHAHADPHRHAGTADPHAHPHAHGPAQPHTFGHAHPNGHANGHAATHHRPQPHADAGRPQGLHHGPLQRQVLPTLHGHGAGAGRLDHDAAPGRGRADQAGGGQGGGTGLHGRAGAGVRPHRPPRPGGSGVVQ